jgi:hypothetical protein
LHVGVKADDVGAKSGKALGHECADATQTDDADGFFIQLNTGKRRALPLTCRKRLVRSGDVTSQREDVGNGKLRGAHNVGGGGVDHHDTSGSGR